MDYNTMKGLLDDPAAKTKITVKEGDKSITMERTPSEQSMTANGLLGGMVSGMSPSPVADDKMINVTSGEFVVNKPAAQKYAGLLEDINNEGREMLARGGYTGSSMMEGYAQGGKTALSNKISKIHGEGYTAPGQAYAIAKSMGYAEGGEVTWTNNPQEDAVMIMQHPLFKRLVGESKMYGYDAAELPAQILGSQLGRLFDTPEKMEALHIANAAAQAEGNAFAEGGPIGEIAKSKRGVFTEKAKAAGMTVQQYADHVLAEGSGASAETRKQANFARNAAKWNKAEGGMIDDALAQSGQSRYHYDLYGPSEETQRILDEMQTAATQSTGETPAVTPDSLLGNGDDLVETVPGTTIVEDDVAVSAAPEGEETAKETTPFSQVTPGVLDNRSFDFILEKSRGLAAGKGFGGAKLGAREYVDELYKPAETAKGGAAGKRGRSANIRWRDENGQEQVRAGTQIDGEWYLKNDAGELVPASDVTGTQDYQVTGRSSEPGVEAGAGGIPNADSYNDVTGIPSFTFARESESKAYGYTVRAIAADKDLTELEGQIPAEDIASLYGGLAQWASRNANAGVTASVINTLIKDAGLQQYSRQMTKFLQAILRNDTGAAYTGTEIADYLSAFGIAPGTVITPEVLKSFQDGRRQEIAVSIGRTGKAAPYLDGLLSGKYPIPGLGSINVDGNESKASESNDRIKL